MDNNQTIDYTLMHELVEQHGLDLSAAELHGLITGHVCTAASLSENQSWIELIQPYLSDSSSTQTLNSALKLIYDSTQHELEGQMFEFSPILPDQDASFDFRTLEIAAWCQGFLTVLKTSSESSSQLSDDSIEALGDLAQIALAITGDGDENELDLALVELEEYLRISTQMIFDDLNPMVTVH